MTLSFRTFSSLTALGVLTLACTGCQSSVEQGPTSTGTGSHTPSKATMMGKESAPAPIPQKDTPEGQSSLAHPAPDQRIDKP